MNKVIIVANKRLDELEGIINKNLKAFYEVGCALMEIRESKLYKQDYDTFEAYCKDRWDMARRTVYQYIAATGVVKNVRNCAQIPQTESQARPLTKLSPPLQQEAWKKVVETAPEGKVTARYVSKVVSEIGKKSTQKEVKKKAKQAMVVPKDEMVDEDFKRAFDAFYWEVQRARLENWKKTSKEASLRLVILIQDLIEVK